MRNPSNGHTHTYNAVKGNSGSCFIAICREIARLSCFVPSMLNDPSPNRANSFGFWRNQFTEFWRLTDALRQVLAPGQELWMKPGVSIPGVVRPLGMVPGTESSLGASRGMDLSLVWAALKGMENAPAPLGFSRTRTHVRAGQCQPGPHEEPTKHVFFLLETERNQPGGYAFSGPSNIACSE